MKISNWKILKILLILSPIIDNINGFILLNENETNISTIFKTCILLFCLSILFSNFKIKKNQLIFGVLFSTLLIIQLFYIEWVNIGSLSYNLNVTIKMIMPYIVFFCIKKIMMKNNVVQKDIVSILNYYCWFYPLSIILPSILEKIGRAHV